jgi:beta-glucosidase
LYPSSELDRRWEFGITQGEVLSLSFSRRTLARLIGGSAAAAALPVAALPTQPPPSSPRSFPGGFLWGSATASYQVEGAVKEDGRGPSIWDTFSHTQGKTFNGDTGDVADDFFHLYRNDIALMKELGLAAFRFSISWSRVFPTGTGAPNPKGLDFYNRLVDALLASNIQPFCTLFHWDLPQALEDKGGWQSRATPEAFGVYAGYVAKHLSDRVQHFMTLNEMSSFVEIGYKDGRHAPGLKLGPGAVAQVAHHAVLAHGLGVQAIRTNAMRGTQVGLAESVRVTCPVVENDLHIGAARLAMREENARYLTAVLEGRYTDRYLRQLGADAPKFTDADMKAIGSPLDFVGANIYAPEFVRADGSAQGYAVVPRPKSYPHMASDWLFVGPEGLYWGPKLIDELWHPKAIYITENGCSSDDHLTADGRVLDTDRVMFLRNYISQLQRVVSEGAPVKGYFLWSLLDNYEWADGYEKRFGIVYVDFKTQKRTPKLSAEFYKATIAKNVVA